MKQHDVAIRGAGIVGQSLALSLARIGLRVALHPDPARPLPAVTMCAPMPSMPRRSRCCAA